MMRSIKSILSTDRERYKVPRKAGRHSHPPHLAGWDFSCGQ